MIYLQRDKFGRLLRVESAPFEGMTERLATPSKEVIEWQARIEARDRLGRLRESDADMIRVLEAWRVALHRLARGSTQQIAGAGGIPCGTGEFEPSHPHGR